MAVCPELAISYSQRLLGVGFPQETDFDLELPIENQGLKFVLQVSAPSATMS